MKAIILAGGYGTRLYPITLRTPKPLLPLAGKPVIEHTIEALARDGVSEVVVSIKENQGKIAARIGDGRALGCRVSYVLEPAAGEAGKLGSVGALEYVFARLGDPAQCFVVGGDNYFHGLDFAKLKSFHSQSSAHATLALYRLADARQASHYGIAVVDRKGRVSEFVEKPSPQRNAGLLASTAAYYLDDDFLCRHIPEYCGVQRRSGRAADRIGDLWEHYLSSLHLYGYVFDGFWGDIGNYASYVETNSAALGFQKGSVRSHVPTGTVKGKSVVVEDGALVHATAVIRGPAHVGKGVRISKSAVVGPYSSVGAGSTIGPNARVSNSVVLDRVKVGESATVEGSVIDGSTRLGAGSSIRRSSVGYSVYVGENAHLDGCSVYPFQHVSDSSRHEGVQLGKDRHLTIAQQKELDDSCYWL